MAKIDFGPKPIMVPQPVLIVASYDENGIPNAMNAAWGITTDFNEISISMSEHKIPIILKFQKHSLLVLELLIPLMLVTMSV